ncbi:MAG: NAD(P)-binding domain-containing protein [Myxococcales bacterium]|nr:NAD(P)-binding domain-containing protein [Myxococcales bacterium]MCB9531702.1 NAD(P)-binding domain-containing protein [Myxococcales bacterium]
MTARTAVGVVGANRFGVALAELAARNGHDVVLFTTIARRAATLRRYRRLTNKVPELQALHPRVAITTDPAELAERCTLVLLTLSREHLSRVMESLSPALDGAHFVVHAVHILEGPRLLRASEVIRQYTCVKQIGVIAGPAHVSELLAGQPNAAVVGSPFPAVIAAVRSALASDTFRIDGDPDMKGVELAAVLGQVVAIAVGIADGAQMGAAAHATLLTRGLREAVTIGATLGVDAHAFYDLAGVGRLVDALRRGEPNYHVGNAIGSGVPAEEAISGAPGEALGVRVVWQLIEYLDRQQLDLPICRATAAILDGDSGPEALTAALRQVDATA